MTTLWLARHANRADFADPDWAASADHPHDPGLAEWLNADWFSAPPDTRSASTLVDHFPRITQDHSACRTPTYPESKHQALARIGATGQCLADQYENETLLLVGHGITVQGVLHGLIGSDVPDPGCPLASLTMVEGRDKDWSITLRNDTSHLENGARAAERLV